ncbi:ATP-binding protein [Streptomyces longispororuber]|uniref:ATP-binding protein n=1 Tax=Streptomyces longispororuber TaxID=68230 RepID=UPI00210A3B68|nr:regulator [Streptomyces longispororuber]MCQ4213142.1 regulator [Streptomyces longispororuber]
MGRQTEIAEIGVLLSRERLVTLTGVGGVGKSRLARQAGARQAPGFPDGVWLVELSPLRESSSIPLCIYEALQLADQSTRPALQVVAEWLADKELLLVLDCCEHLHSQVAATAGELLAASPGLRILATSRRPLGSTREHVLPVLPLPLGSDPGTGDEPRGAAVELFLDRAGTAAPGLIEAGKDDRDVADICTRLEGIPLAIELAAARLSEMDLNHLRRGLCTRLQTLTSPHCGQDTNEPRHQALHTTIGWSHELCAPLERLLWARVSVFAGGFEEEAAAWVCGAAPLRGEQIAPLLAALVDRSILQRLTTARGPRYHLLDTVREYGQQWLGGLGETATLAERHRDYYRWMARVGDREWVGPDQFAWYDRLTDEHANIRLALENCLASAPGNAFELAGDLWFFWAGCGFIREGRAYLERSLAAATDEQPGRERFWAAWALGIVAVTQGDFTRVETLEEECLELAEQLGNPEAIAAARFLTSARWSATGRPAQAVALLGEVLTLAEGSGKPLAVRLLALGMTAFALLQSGEFARAAEAAEQLRKECERQGEQWMRSFALYYLSVSALADGNPPAAALHARDSLAIRWRMHDTFGAALALDALAPALIASDPGQAARVIGLVDALWDSIGRSRMGSPELLAAREASEALARRAIGDAAYTTAYRQGTQNTIDVGITHTLDLPTPD